MNNDWLCPSGAAPKRFEFSTEFAGADIREGTPVQAPGSPANKVPPKQAPKYNAIKRRDPGAAARFKSLSMNEQSRMSKATDAIALRGYHRRSCHRTIDRSNANNPHAMINCFYPTLRMNGMTVKVSPDRPWNASLSPSAAQNAKSCSMALTISSGSLIRPAPFWRQLNHPESGPTK